MTDTIKTSPCFIQLGRFGDIIQLLPAFKAIKDRSGDPPVVVVSNEYANVFDGVSYVKAWTLPLQWSSGVPAARGIAEVEFPAVVTPQFWNDSRSQFTSEVGRQVRMLQCHGEQWAVDLDKWPDYGTAMWSRVGFSRNEMMTLPLVFDRRDAGREDQLAQAMHPTRPNLLVNWKGISSPFPWVPEFHRSLHRFRDRFNVVDLEPVKAHRIYDLLGLYDRAAGLITVDTATLHLAPASKVPYVAFTRGDWSGSVPKGNCVLNISYPNAHRRMTEFERVLQSWAGDPVPGSRVRSVVTRGGGGAAVFR